MDFVAGVSGGANSLWLTEWLTEALDLRPGMRVLDLGCGRGRLVRLPAAGVRRAGLGDRSLVQRRASDSSAFRTPVSRTASFRSRPMRGRCRLHPAFFDAIVSIDAFPYFGTDDLYLGYLARFVKPDGLIAIAGAGLVQEIEGAVPDICAPGGRRTCRACTRPAGGGGIGSEPGSSMSKWPRRCRMAGGGGWIGIEAVAPDNHAEIQAVASDHGRYLGYVRSVCRRRPDAPVPELIASVPVEYKKTPILADETTALGGVREEPIRPPFRRGAAVNRRDLLKTVFVLMHRQPAAGAVSTLIGTGTAGYSDQQVNNPYGLAIGPDGALYFCDLDNQRIRRLDLATRRTTTIAGNGEQRLCRRRRARRRSVAEHAARDSVRRRRPSLHRRTRQPRRPEGRCEDRRSSRRSPAPAAPGSPATADPPAAHSCVSRTASRSTRPPPLLICDIGNHRIRRVDLATRHHRHVRRHRRHGSRRPTARRCGERR